MFKRCKGVFPNEKEETEFRELFNKRYYSPFDKYRIEQIKELRQALMHCVNVLKEYERKPGEDLKGFMLGALDNAEKVLSNQGAERFGIR